MPDGTEPIYLYLRLSKYHGDKADSIERQRLDLVNLLKKQGGWTVFGEFVDNDSASSSAARVRKGWKLLNEGIDRGEVGAVAFWKLDRTNRVASETLAWLAKCRTFGIALVSHEDPADELNTASASAKIVIGIKSIFAEIETDTMSLRQKASKRHLAEAGFHHGGQVPFGWTSGGERLVDEHGRTGTRLAIHPVEFPALQDAVRMIVSGDSLADVSRYWRDRYGLVTADGGLLGLGNIRRYLASPRLMGYRMRNVPEFERGVTVNLMDYIARDDRGQPVISQPAVCNRATWLRLQKALSDGFAGTHRLLDGSASPGRRPWGSNEWLLSGHLVCATCGRRMHGRTRKNRTGETIRRYVCISRLKGYECSTGMSVEGQAVEQFVTSWLFAFLTPDRIAIAKRQLARRAGDRAFDRTAAELDGARVELMALQAEQGSPRWRGSRVSMFLSMVADAADRIESLEKQMAALTLHEGDLPPSGEELAGVWEGLSLSKRRVMLRRVIKTITVESGRRPVNERLTFELTERLQL